jgi:hypothetical protein
MTGVFGGRAHIIIRRRVVPGAAIAPSDSPRLINMLIKYSAMPIPPQVSAASHDFTRRRLRARKIPLPTNSAYDFLIAIAPGITRVSSGKGLTTRSSRMRTAVLCHLCHKTGSGAAGNRVQRRVPSHRDFGTRKNPRTASVWRAASGKRPFEGVDYDRAGKRAGRRIASKETFEREVKPRCRPSRLRFLPLVTRCRFLKS